MKEKMQKILNSDDKIAVWMRCLILFAGTQILCYIFVWRLGMFGSDVDWINQHSVLPDYFRQRFYDTGSLFPDMAWNLGAGQNIYNFSYYGLFSPVILFSYLLPFVPMTQYVMWSSMVSYGVSVVLFYIWISDRKKGFSSGMSFFTAAVFGLAAPMMYQFYNQLMFVNYMPFLCLALIGTDRYVQKGRRGMLIAGTLGMILTSFYFSVGGILALGLYLIGEEITWKQFWGYIGNVLIGISLAGILLLPTAAVLFGGERTSAETVKIASDETVFSAERYLYSPYGLGLSSFGVFALLYGVLFPEKNKAFRRRHLQAVLLVMLLTVPIVAKLLNGGLYAKNKVFLPFLPMICLGMPRCLKQLKNHTERNWKEILKWIVLAAGVFTCVSMVNVPNEVSSWWYLPLLDGLLMFVSVIVYCCKKKIPLPLLLAFGILLVYDGFLNQKADVVIKEQDYEALHLQEKKQDVEQITEEDTGYYRMAYNENNKNNLDNINRVLCIRQNLTSIYSSGYNREYHDFRKNIFQLNQAYRNDMMDGSTNDPCFLQLMGVRYIIGDQSAAGYEKIKDGTDYSIYKNENAAPVCYATTQVVKASAYEALEFPYNQTVLLKYAVAEGEEKDLEQVEQMKPASLDIPLLQNEQIQITKTEDGYEVNASEIVDIQTTVKEASVQSVDAVAEKDDICAIELSVENLCPENDMHILINGQNNRLSSEKHAYANHNTQFQFMVTLQEDGTSVDMQFSKGQYIIHDVQAWMGSMKKLRNEELYESELVMDEKQPDGDSLSGQIETEKDAWLITSFPYDDNFKIEVDGKEVQKAKVNASFLGAKLSAGRHNIVITYQAPGKQAGMLCSLFGIIVLLVSAVYRKYRTGGHDGAATRIVV